MKLTDVIDTEYKNVEEQTKQPYQNKKSAGIDLLFSLWERERSFLEKNYINIFSSENFYLCIESNLKKEQIKEIALQDITEFSLRGIVLQEEKMFEAYGSFLSAVINLHHKYTKTNEEYVIHTSHLEKLVHRIGTYNRAHIRVKGNVGERSGLYMKSGRLLIEGNSSFFLGNHMQGGTIELFGSTWNAAGEQMSGGTIIIHENTTLQAGTNMFGGKLIVMKDADAIGAAQQGGIIEVRGQVRGDVGTYMQGGKLYLSEPFTYLGKGYSHGKIYVQNKLVMSRWIRYKNKIKELFK